MASTFAASYTWKNINWTILSWEAKVLPGYKNKVVPSWYGLSPHWQELYFPHSMFQDSVRTWIYMCCRSRWKKKWSRAAAFGFCWKLAQAPRVHIFLTTWAYVIRPVIRQRETTSQRELQHFDKLDLKGRVNNSLLSEGMTTWHETFSTTC